VFTLLRKLALVGIRSSRICRRAFVQYRLELQYFLKAKKFDYSEDFRNKNPALVLRKKTHHLERYLLSPDEYVAGFAEGLSQEVADILDMEDGIPDNLSKWTRRILKEYHSGCLPNSNSCCPMLEKQVDRKTSPVSSKSLMTLLRQRRSRRIFIDEALTEEEKEIICEAAQLAPSSCNRQTISLIFIEEKELKKIIASTIPGGHQFFANAPSLLVFVSEAGDYRYPDDRMVPFIDGAAAAQNIYLLCETIGFGCCWGSYTSFGSVRDEVMVRKKLKIPDTHLIVASMAIGKSSQFVCEIPRDDPKLRYWNNQFGKKE
jgi:nitroreductase